MESVRQNNTCLRHSILVSISNSHNLSERVNKAREEGGIALSLEVQDMEKTKIRKCVATTRLK